jgi:hypothetical protein
LNFPPTKQVPPGGPCKVHAEGKAGPDQQGGATIPHPPGQEFWPNDANGLTEQKQTIAD